MPKRKHSETDNGAVQGLDDLLQKKGPNKNSLDSDEDDEDDSDNERYELRDEDIEGQEDGNVGTEEGVQITPFNMKEELEEGHFDTDGMYHWKKEKLARDNWLENIDWIKIKQKENKSDLNESEENVQEMPDSVDITALYKEILTYLLPKETISKALKRHGGSKSLSASERLKLKKSGLSYNSMKGDGEKVSKLTELANKILTHCGNMDIYQETYEYISDKLNASSSKATAEPELDMYADDFGAKEKERLTDTSASNKPEAQSFEHEKVMWEYKKEENSSEIKGPYSSEQMEKWSQSGHFGNGVLVRKCGTVEFHTSNRIDFDLYI